MSFKSWFKKEEQDSLAFARQLHSDALSVFHDALDQLRLAEGHLEDVKASEQSRINAAQARIDEASAAQTANAATITKLEDLTSGTSA